MRDLWLKSKEKLLVFRVIYGRIHIVSCKTADSIQRLPEGDEEKFRVSLVDPPQNLYTLIALSRAYLLYTGGLEVIKVLICLLRQCYTAPDSCDHVFSFLLIVIKTNQTKSI